MFQTGARLCTVFLAAGLLAGCGRSPLRAASRPEPAVRATDYAVPPAVTLVRPTPGGPLIDGVAAADVQVRLGSPTGQAFVAAADPQGRWSLRLPPSSETRIFGLSERIGGRQAQGQGYLVITPEGRSALLRAGSGAVRLDPQRSPFLGAVDFDQAREAVVSGLAPGGSRVFLRIDGLQMAQASADDRGRYVVALPEPISPGVHVLEISGDAFTDRGVVEVSPAAPLVAGPLRSQFTRGGRRIDWLTPGGGVQTTVLLD